MREWMLYAAVTSCFMGAVVSAIGSEPHAGLEVEETGARRQARLQAQANQQLAPQAQQYSYGTNYCCSNPWRIFANTQHLYWNRDASVSSPNVIGGANPLNFSNLDIDNEWGTRFKVGAGYNEFDLQIVYSELDVFEGSNAGALNNGIAFDDGITGQWTGGNFINSSTFFSPINAAATFNNGVIDENDETDGFGPTASFFSDLPTFSMVYRSKLEDFELNLRHAPVDHWFKVGVGYRTLDYDEFAGVSIRGELRNHTDGGGVNEGISHIALTDPNGGNLTHLGGAADGFDDIVSANGPDTLLFTQQATVYNNLDGGQILLEPTIYEGDYLIFDSSIKAGVYSNRATGRINELYSGVIGDNSVYGRSFESTRNVTSFVGNVSLNLGFKLTDHVILQYGYEWMYMTDVALAPDQYIAIRGNTYQVNTDSDVRFHGSKFGVAVNW